MKHNKILAIAIISGSFISLNLPIVSLIDRAYAAEDGQSVLLRKQSYRAVLGLSDSNLSEVSAQKRLPLTVQKLEKQDYSLNEDVLLTINNPESEDFTMQVFDANDTEIPVASDQVNYDISSDIEIHPPSNLTPGAYTIVVTDERGREHKQDFNWGMIAVNTDKAVYQPNDIAKLSTSITDADGAIVCDANVQYIITTPEGNTDTLSTENKTINRDPNCIKTDPKTNPDYQADYFLVTPGTYDIQVSETSHHRTHTSHEQLVVQKKPAVTIQRTGSTRVAPGVATPMQLQVTVSQDFAGVISETVPDSFTITPSSQSATYDSVDEMYSKGDDKPVVLEKKDVEDSVSRLGLPFNDSFPISQGFGAANTDPSLTDFYAKLGLAGHDGIDYALPEKTALFATDDGQVITAGQAGYGNTVVIKHAWGKSYYGHLSKITVAAGMYVTRGSQIGYSGNTGESTGPHLHFAIKPNKTDSHNGYVGNVDPLPFLPKALPKIELVPTPEPLIPRGMSMSMDRVVLSASTSADQSSLTPTPTPTEEPSLSPTLVPEPTASATATITASPSATDDLVTNNDNSPAPVAPKKQAIVRTKVIKWLVHLKKGEKVTLAYMYTTPLVSPQVYTLGPLQMFTDTDDTLAFFEEGRKWEITSDVVDEDLERAAQKLQ